ncbi:hypothetical protein CCACVL1_21708 [Corchorus capsularis]|uniref:Uncharacterized protein n=1 Tax=Corchorus capsularis TaxID=210143 RepID=A0A1R3H2N5_COCAP|nr:hypothetical protein CCACVL1_21708 [Corchorus capsularis]
MEPGSTAYLAKAANLVTKGSPFNSDILLSCSTDANSSDRRQPRAA